MNRLHRDQEISEIHINIKELYPGKKKKQITNNNALKKMSK